MEVTTAENAESVRPENSFVYHVIRYVPNLVPSGSILACWCFTATMESFACD